MHLRSLLIIVVLLAGLACERQNRELGGARKELAGTPKYTQAQAPEISKIPAPVHVASIAPVLGTGAIDGSALYAKSCGACHQPTGVGIPNVFPPLANSPYVVGDNVERLAAIMVYGLTGPITVLGTQYNSAMAGLGAQFNDEELAAVATYVRSSWGNQAPPVEPDVFAGVRQKWGARGPFTIDELGGSES